jgi:subtilisin family serine protease
LTWGLIATKVDLSLFTGRGVNVAVLDTGIDLKHPDFGFPGARPITSSSFIAGEPVQDGNGHGTHTTGTTLGIKRPNGTSRRYGVAFEGNIFSGKVLSNAGSGSDGGILAGIDWAIRNGCRIVSMSLGGATRPGEAFSPVYEAVARRALDQGTIIICAAGNDSSRPGIVRPVSRPANCPSIMAVAAIDNTGAVAAFSNRGSATGGGQVDIAGPGVAVFSSWPTPRNYRTIDGTSMATPHVAGIAALYLQQNPALSARDLWRALQANALRLGGLTVDVGAGLVQSV